MPSYSDVKVDTDNMGEVVSSILRREKYDGKMECTGEGFKLDRELFEHG
jgi:hypothetical protein